MTSTENSSTTTDSSSTDFVDQTTQTAGVGEESGALSPEDEAYAERLAQNAAYGTGSNGNNCEGDDDEAEPDDGDDTGGSFNSVPPVKGEIRVPLSALGEWDHHLRKGSRKKGEHAAALTLTAADPEALKPLVVLPKTKGIHPIVDGRFLWLALKAAHPGNKDVMVRCIVFEGDEAAAVASVCDTALGVIGASAIEQAQALLSLKLTNDVSQTAIAKRYARLTVSKVSNMLIAAKMKKAHPVLFDILLEADRAPIQYGCDILTLKKTLPASEFQDVLDRAADLIENGERFKPGEAFSALQIQRPGKAAAAALETAEEEELSEDVFGHDDQPVGTSQEKANGSFSLGLPTTAAVAKMTFVEREAAADAFIILVRRHFDLGEVD